MFRIDSLKDIEQVAKLQNELSSFAIERNMLNHRPVNYRVFLIKVDTRNKGGNYFTNVVLKNYFSHLHFFSQMVVTSTGKFRRGVLPLCIPTYSQSAPNFYTKLDHKAGSLSIRLNDNLTAALVRACKFVEMDINLLSASLIGFHQMHNEPVGNFEGIIEGAWYKTLRAKQNRKSWPIKAKGEPNETRY